MIDQKTQLVSERTSVSADGLPKVSPSMRSTWKRCPRKVFFRYVAGIEEKWPKNAARFIGSAFHSGIEAWRRSNNTQFPDRKDDIVAMAFERLNTDLITNGFAEKAPVETAKLWAYLQGYFIRYINDINDFPGCGTEQIIEGPFDIGILDGFWFDEKTGEVTIIEEKTRSDFSEGRAWALTFDEQLLTYGDMVLRSGIKCSKIIVRYRETLKSKLRLSKGETIGQFADRVLGEYNNVETQSSKFREIRVELDMNEVAFYAAEKTALDLDIRSRLARCMMLQQYPRNCNECIGTFGACEFLTACFLNNKCPENLLSGDYKANNKQPLDGGAWRNAAFGKNETQKTTSTTTTIEIEREWWDD